MLFLWARFVVVLLIVPLNLNERSSLLTYFSRIAIAKRNLCSSYHDWLDVCVCVCYLMIPNFNSPDLVSWTTITRTGKKTFAEFNISIVD